MRDTLEVESTAKVWLCMAWCTGVFIMPVCVFMIVICGWLGFDSPDPINCWVSDAEPGVIYNLDPGLDGFENYGTTVRFWFGWGFITTCVWTIFCLSFMAGVCCKDAAGLCVSVFGLLLHIVNLAWVIYGFIVFNTPGALTALGQVEEGSGPTFATTPAQTMHISNALLWPILYFDLAVVIYFYLIMPCLCCIAGCCGSKDD